MVRSGAVLAAGGALAGAGCGKSSHSSAKGDRSSAEQSLDVRLLVRSLELEYEAIAAYTAGIPLLAGRSRDDAERFLDQELSHSGELAGLIKQAGAKPPKSKPAYDFGSPRSSRDVLVLLHELERREVALYLDSLTQYSLGSTRAAIAAVVANDAQHLALLRQGLRLDPIPTPLVTGRE